MREDLYHEMMLNLDPGSPQSDDNTLHGIRRTDSNSSSTYDSVDDGDFKGSKNSRSPRKAFKKSQKQNNTISNSNNNSSSNIMVSVKSDSNRENDLYGNGNGNENGNGNGNGNGNIDDNDGNSKSKIKSSDSFNKKNVPGIGHLVDSSLASYRLKNSSPENKNQNKNKKSPSNLNKKNSIQSISQSNSNNNSHPDFYMSSTIRGAETHSILSNSPKSKASSTPVLTTRKMFDGHLFDGNECCGFSMSRALSVDDLRIKDGESSPISPVFSRSDEGVEREGRGKEKERGIGIGIRGGGREYVDDDDAIIDNLNKSSNKSDSSSSSNNSAGTENYKSTTQSTLSQNGDEKSGKLATSNQFPSSSSIGNPHSDTTQKTISRKSGSTSLLSANRKSIFNFQSMLKSASTDDFSLLTRGEKPSNIFEKTVKLTRNNNNNYNKNNNSNNNYNNNNHNNHTVQPQGGQSSEHSFRNNKSSTNDNSNNNNSNDNNDKKGLKGLNIGSDDDTRNIKLNYNSNTDEKKIGRNQAVGRFFPHPFSPPSPSPSPPGSPKDGKKNDLVKKLEKLTLIDSKNISVNNCPAERTVKNIVRYSGTTPLPLLQSDDTIGLNPLTSVETCGSNDAIGKLRENEKEIEIRSDKSDDVSVMNHNLIVKQNENNSSSSSSTTTSSSSSSINININSNKAHTTVPRSSSSSPLFHTINLSTENVFRLGDQLALKNVNIQACRKLFFENSIVKDEYEKLIRTELRFLEEKTRSEAIAATLRLKNIFGESWSDKKSRILGNYYENFDRNGKFGKSMNNDNIEKNIIECVSDSDSDDEDDYWPSKNVISFIVKSNDDLRQEVCCLQMMQICNEIFNDFNLNTQLYLKPYRIVSTGSSTGLVQVLTDTLSLDALKKTPGFVNLPHYYRKTFGTSAERLSAAKRNFASSLAAYSLFCYILQIKDRHNGNLLIDQEGHIIHIDFGFLLSIAPGKQYFHFSFTYSYLLVS